MTTHVKLFLPSIPGYEKIARSAAEALAEEMAFPRDRIEDLKTAVAEVCQNAIEHGNAQRRGANVMVVMTPHDDKLEIRVADIGQRTIPEELPQPARDGLRGWGMFFIQNLVDEIEIIRLPEGGNQVRLAFYLAPPQPPAARPATAAHVADPSRSGNGTPPGQYSELSPEEAEEHYE